MKESEHTKEENSGYVVMKYVSKNQLGKRVVVGGWGTPPVQNCIIWILSRPPFKLTGGFFFYVLYSTLLRLPPLRSHCVGGCWDRTQDCCDFGIGSIFIEQKA
jgi:hypothetical protein